LSNKSFTRFGGLGVTFSACLLPFRILLTLNWSFLFMSGRLGKWGEGEGEVSSFRLDYAGVMEGVIMGEVMADSDVI